MRRGIQITGILGAVTLLAFQLGALGNSVKTIASTVPRNGDQNPYGVAVVPESLGALVAGNVLVSNFNDAANLQGAGTTIDQIDAKGNLTVFAALNAKTLPGPCPGGVGLTTALAVLRSGWVIVGSVPTADGTSDTIQPGCLVVLNDNGQPVMTLSGTGVNGPWDMAALDLGVGAVLFVSNVLDGSIERLVLSTPLLSSGMPQEIAPRMMVAGGFPERPDPLALIIGPTGLGLGFDGTLYVADTLNNRIAGVSNALFRTNSAGTGQTVSQGKALNGPLGLAIETNGDILTVNGGDSNLVETTPGGEQVAVKAIDVSGTGAGSLFGLAVVPGGVYFVDDGNNTLNILR